MKNNRTRGRILDVSTEMFNRKMSSNVSTVQISNEMGISPGNLYYYYSNKEEIIRVIWKERIAKEGADLIEQLGKTDSIEGFEAFCRDYTEHFERYRFFYLETPTLLFNDPGLREICDPESTQMTEALVDVIARIRPSKGADTVRMTEEERITEAENLRIIIHGMWIFKGGSKSVDKTMTYLRTAVLGITE